MIYTNKQKLLACLLILTFLITVLSGCGKNEKVKAIQSLDRAGNEILIPGEINSIVSMSPSITQILIDLGQADKIVAIDTASAVYLDQLPADIPQFDAAAPDNDALISLAPDIIFTYNMSSFEAEDKAEEADETGKVVFKEKEETTETVKKGDVYKAVRKEGICIADIPEGSSFSDITEDVKFIGTTVQATEKANELIKEFNTKVSDIRSVSENMLERKTVLIECTLPAADHPFFYTFGSGTYFDEIINSIGASNAAGNYEGWIEISEEEAIMISPDVIITNVENSVDSIMGSPGWENVPAITNGSVYYLDKEISGQQTTHIVDVMVEIAKLVYPDLYAEY